MLKGKAKTDYQRNLMRERRKLAKVKEQNRLYQRRWRKADAKARRVILARFRSSKDLVFQVDEITDLLPTAPSTQRTELREARKKLEAQLQKRLEKEEQDITRQRRRILKSSGTFARARVEHS